MGRIIKIRLKLNFILFFIFLNGCVFLDLSEFDHENNIFIHITNDEYFINYIQFFDSDEVPFYYPHEAKKWKENDNQNNQKLELNRAFNFDDSSPSIFQLSPNSEKKLFTYINPSIVNKDLITEGPFSISNSNFIIFKDFKLRGIFKSPRLIDEFNNIINDIDNANSDEIFEFESLIEKLISHLYLEAINNSTIEFNKKHIYLNSIKNFNQIIDPKTIIQDIKNGDLKISSLNKIFLPYENFLFQSIDIAHRDEVKSKWDELKSEFYITVLLFFNDFTIKTIMPGEIVFHNSDTLYQDTLLWNIHISDFAQRNYEIIAHSRVIYKGRIILLIIISFLILLGCYFWSRRKNN